MQDDVNNQKSADFNKDPNSNTSNSGQNTYGNVSGQNGFAPGQGQQSGFVNTQSVYGNHQNGYSAPYQQPYQTGQKAGGYTAPSGRNMQSTSYYGTVNGTQNHRTSGNASTGYAGIGAVGGNYAAPSGNAAAGSNYAAPSGNAAAGSNYAAPSGNAAAGSNYAAPSGNAAAGSNYAAPSGNAAAGSNYAAPSGNAAAGSNYAALSGKAAACGNFAATSGNMAANGPRYTGNSAGGFGTNAAAGAELNKTNTEVKESRKKKKEKKKSETKDGTFRKVALSAVYGLVFGLIAGLAFFAVKEIGGQMGLVSDTADHIQIAEVPVTEEDSISSTAGNNGQTTDSKQQVINPADVVQTNNSTTFVAVDDVSSVVDKVMPSIVSVINSYTADYYYFSEEEEASGSGIIIGSNDDELLVVTNYHVIQGNDSLKVIFCDEAEAMAQVKGQDKEMDLAVIAIPLTDISSDTKKNISIATMGDSDNLKVGETAIAIGNSLGFGQSVSKGIISAVNREMDMNGVKGTFIQTDAAINPGNSGGALLNINGEVIGINSNKLGGSAVEGMGYAIPITAAKPILEDLMIKETKKLADNDKQSYLGISGANITSQEQAFYGYPDGIYVANVYEDTAAEQAGLQKGDFIVTFDGEEVSSMEDLQKLLLYYEAGTTVEMEIYRSSPTGYKQMTITVTLGNRNDMKD